MKGWLPCLLLIFCPAGTGQLAALEFRVHEVELVRLPEWGEKEKLDDYVLGGQLWPSPSEKSSPHQTELPLAIEGQPDSSSLPAESVRATLLQSFPEWLDWGPRKLHSPVTLPELKGKVLHQFFGNKPRRYLFDPQRIVPDQRANDILRFIESHARRSRFEIYLVVLGEKQVLPDDLDLGEIHRRWFGKSAAVLVIFRESAPYDSRFVFSDDLPAELPDGGHSIERMENQCFKVIEDGEPVARQLEKLIIELSIQLFSLEKKLQDRPRSPVILASALPPGHDMGNMIRGFGRDDAAGNRGALILTAMLAGAVFMVFVLVLLIKRQLARARRGSILFPHCTGARRLGGEHSGGTFVGISFELGKTGETYQ